MMHWIEHYLNWMGLKDNFNAWVEMSTAVRNKDDEPNFFDVLEECGG